MEVSQTQSSDNRGAKQSQIIQNLQEDLCRKTKKLRLIFFDFQYSTKVINLIH